MITPRNLDGRPAIVRRAMHDLMVRWPVGQPVRHAAGWTGRVTPDFVGNPHSLTGTADSHCMVTAAPDSGCVCVQRDDGMTAWYFPRALTLIGAKDAPAPAAPAAERPAPKPRAGDRQRQRRRVS